MNPKELALIRFLAASLAFMRLNPYTFRGYVLFGVEKTLYLLKFAARRHVGEENTLAETKLSFLNEYFTTFNLR